MLTKLPYFCCMILIFFLWDLINVLNGGTTVSSYESNYNGVDCRCAELKEV